MWLICRIFFLLQRRNRGFIQGSNINVTGLCVWFWFYLMFSLTNRSVNHKCLSITMKNCTLFGLCPLRDCRQCHRTNYFGTHWINFMYIDIGVFVYYIRVVRNVWKPLLRLRDIHHTKALYSFKNITCILLYVWQCNKFIFIKPGLMAFYIIKIR